ncbi:MAG: tripartite tricarboxylate transporter permease [Rhizobiaceae bacterium]|nr:tripartite tricarboxylate transporter permease [Rhizobiaceae bacterium]|tara:strand:+ start:6672 stop:8156 length:1485 start_codon:yes stop_codon:yes gene_type:complete
MFSDFQLGLQVALSWDGLLMCALGVTLGTFIGVLPGVGVLATIAMLLPVTFGMEPAIGLIMLAGVFYGAAYGGSTASILLNLPGTANTAVTCLDGFPLNQQGRGSMALFVTAIASFIGSMSGAIILAVLSHPLAELARGFGSQEYFALLLLGIVAASSFSTVGLVRAIAMTFLGILIGLIGVDINTGTERFTFGSQFLYDGMPLVALAIGLFGIPEVIKNLADKSTPENIQPHLSYRAMLPSFAEWKRALPAMGRGAGVGSVLGVLPGAGSLIASFVSYAIERNISKTPEAFGKGAIEGISSPEAANNAAIQTAFVPTLTLGVPGDSTMAIVLAALLVHGINPGPEFASQHPDIFWGLIVSFLIGNFLLLIINIPLIGIWVRLLSIPYTVLFPSIVVFSCVGVYSVRYEIIDVLFIGGFAALGYALRLFRLEAAPLLLGFVLGPMLEEHFRRTLLLSRGDLGAFVEQPISIALYLASAGMVLWVARNALKKRYR